MTSSTMLPLGWKTAMSLKITNGEDFFSFFLVEPPFNMATFFILVRLKTDLVANLCDVYVLIGDDHGDRRDLEGLQGHVSLSQQL